MDVHRLRILQGSFFPFRVHVPLFLELIMLNGTHSAVFLKFTGDDIIFDLC